MGNKTIPVIDLFAGPGGLAEGFSSVFQKNNKRVFDIKLSIEKDENAHKTLELRSFYRQFEKANLPEEYYDLIKETNLSSREDKRQELFEKYPKEAEMAKVEAWCCELGNKKYPNDVIDKRIQDGLKKRKDWVLIGGPPCQAYSLVGRSRVGGIDNQDHRVYLYKEYLRIIAKHHPAVFVMENVKGLLSAKVGEERVFDWMLKDLKEPGSVFEGFETPKYKIHSLVVKDVKKDRDYLIKAEDYGVPQKRHRVILLGIREDIEALPSRLEVGEKVKLEDVIGDLPKLRSGLGRSIISSKTINGKKKRVYKNEIDSNENWAHKISEIKKEVHSWNGFASNKSIRNVKASEHGIGSEFVKCDTPLEGNPLKEWYKDKKLNGVSNHETRTHLLEDLKRYFFCSTYAKKYKRFPRLVDYEKHNDQLMPDHESAKSGKFADRFRVQMPDIPATTVTSHISKDGHYFIHYDPEQCRSLTVREAARIQTFPDNYLFCGPRTAQYHQVGNAVPPFLAFQIGEVVNKLFENEQN